jgi:hypothetical protein
MALNIDTESTVSNYLLVLWRAEPHYGCKLPRFEPIVIWIRPFASIISTEVNSIFEFGQVPLKCGRFVHMPVSPFLFHIKLCVLNEINMNA